MTLSHALLDPRRLPWWLAVVAAAGSAFLLLADPAWLGPLGLDAIRREHGEALGLILLGATAFVLVGVVASLVDRLSASRAIRRRIAALDAAEQAVLREFVLQGRNTIAAPLQDLPVAGLLTDAVLAQVGGQVQPTPGGLVVAIRIDPAVRQRLTPEAIGLASWSPAEAERRRLLGRRPAFVSEVARWDAIFQL